jgi:hypothetical protein
MFLRIRSESYIGDRQKNGRTGFTLFSKEKRAR